MVKCALTTAFGITLTLATSLAHAQPAAAPAAAAASDPATEPAAAAPKSTTYSVGALLGGTGNGYGFGLGVRGGATVASRIYFGGIFLYHVGTSNSFGKGDLGTSAIQLGGEVGYAIPVLPVVIRPFAGLGLLVGYARYREKDAGYSDSRTGLALSLGCTVAYRIPNSVFAVGGELRAIVPLDGRTSALGLFAVGSLTL